MAKLSFFMLCAACALALACGPGAETRADGEQAASAAPADGQAAAAPADGQPTAAALTDASADTGPISCGDLAGRIAGGSAPLILDVRSAGEFGRGHIPGAVNIPHDELATRFAELSVSSSGELVVHCQVGGRARAAEEVLRQGGFSNVRDLTGHWGEWKSAGHPSE
ncbi:MAG: hypothetical protein DRQ55_17400 [Planctomycetota bacterium]|nr:MAG: hypothetical protein DRQ55_17400 [Planctomycetota bacterium]